MGKLCGSGDDSASREMIELQKKEAEEARKKEAARQKRIEGGLAKIKGMFHGVAPTKQVAGTFDWKKLFKPPTAAQLNPYTSDEADRAAAMAVSGLPAGYKYIKTKAPGGGTTKVAVPTSTPGKAVSPPKTTTPGKAATPPKAVLTAPPAAATTPLKTTKHWDPNKGHGGGWVTTVSGGGGVSAVGGPITVPGKKFGKDAGNIGVTGQTGTSGGPQGGLGGPGGVGKGQGWTAPGGGTIPGGAAAPDVWAIQGPDGTIYYQGQNIPTTSTVVTGEAVDPFAALYDKYRKDILGYYMPEVKSQYSDANTELMYRLARAGTLASSAANREYADLSKQNVEQEANVKKGAEEQVGSLKKDVAAQEQNAINQLYATENPDVAVNQATAAIRNITADKPDLTPLADVFKVATVGGAASLGAAADQRRRAAYVPYGGYGATRTVGS
jgi:hypothetical protein